eukprot:3894779-Pyramimonas_sp.AAC.1
MRRAVIAASRLEEPICNGVAAVAMEHGCANTSGLCSGRATAKHAVLGTESFVVRWAVSR